MQQPNSPELAMREDFEARQLASYAFEGNRAERRAEAAIARRHARLQEQQARSAAFYGTAGTIDLIAG